MENVMKNKILRILISAILFSLISGILVVITGILLGWKTSIQFSDGFFWAGAILISIGFLSVLGGINERAMSGPYYSQSALHLTMAERSKLWTEDILQGYNILGFLGTSGVLLFGIAFLVGRL
jgi:hypothetical protein